MSDKGLITIRGLTEGEAQTPLRKFYGVLKEYYPDEHYGKTRVVMNFTDVEVLESTEPYHFPTATINPNLSNRKNSNWGVFSSSLAALLPEDQDIKDCVGKRIGLVMEVGRVYGKDRDTGEDMIGNPWHVFEVAGVVAGAKTTTSVDRARELLSGKTRAEFNKAAYADPIIRQDPDLQRAITDKSFINSVVQLGEFAEDGDGVFQKVK